MKKVTVKIPGFLDRMIKEADELFEKKTKLSNYLDKMQDENESHVDEECFGCKFEDEIDQFKAMDDYFNILMKRINNETLHQTRCAIARKIEAKEDDKKFD